MSTTSTPGTTSGTATKPGNGTAKAPRNAPNRRTRSGVEAATSKVMNLIGRLPEADQRKVIAAVTALVAKDVE